MHCELLDNLRLYFVMSSKPFVKQHSLESPDPRLAQNGRAVPAANLNRSLTMVERRRPSAGVSRRSRDSSSPLKRFTKAKDAILRAFGLIRDRLTESQSFIRLAHDDVESKPLADLLGRTEGIETALSRDHMKVAFFGRTSNGKSSVINALLHNKVLPAGIGHTTNCFCSVVGEDSEEGYVLSPLTQEKQNVKNVQQLAHSLHKGRLEHSSLVEVFWPKSKCALLQDDVEFVDSPGIDMNPDMDEWIDKHCLDADVFVLVSNAESTLMTAEKKFFHRVSERLSKPNIFILNNRWDCSASEPEMMDEVREQHLKCDVDFLAKELKVADELTAKNRVFFVSAKEALLYRTRVAASNPAPGEGLAEGFRGRLAEFEHFEKHFKECVSNAAILTKFEHHHKQGTEVINELAQLLEDEEKSIQQSSTNAEEELKASRSKACTFSGQGSKIKEKGSGIVFSATATVGSLVEVESSEITTKLSSILEKFQHDFDLASGLGEYKSALFEFMDERLKEEMERVGGSRLADQHEVAMRSLTEPYQTLLQLPAKDLTQFSQMVAPPTFGYVLKCKEMCKDFRADLEFRFFLSPSSLLGSLSVSSVVGGVQSQVASVASIVPTEIAFGAILLASGYVLNQVLSWKYLIPCVAVYGGLYALAWLRWTTASKEAALKEQFIKHITPTVKLQISTLGGSYGQQLCSGLQHLQTRLDQVVEDTLAQEKERIRELEGQSQRFIMLQDRAKKLRNAVMLLKTDLGTFKEDYLERNDSSTVDP